MKRMIFILPFAFALTAQGAPKSEVESVKLGGYIGTQIDGCIEKRVIGQSVDELIEPFKLQDEVNNRWASEFWGKWIQGAVSSYRYNKSPELLAKIEDAEKKLIATQLPDGYIGDYDTEHQLKGWDVWGRKYTLLGLIKCYRLMGHKEALKAAQRLLDYTITQIGPGTGRHINRCGMYRGMPPLSILEPVTFMYNETGDQRYLDFAKHIVEEMEGAEGPKLLTKADVPVSMRYPLQEGQGWWSFENGQKGYEMMSCYVGLLEMYRLTANAQYLQAALSTWNHIMQEEINITGGACSLECWYGGQRLQQLPTAHTMETCVTFTWMQFCERLHEITGEAKYIDQIERTMYNALMASIKDDHSQIVKYVPLEGFRREGEHQCDVKINCCNANAPRAFAMIPRIAYRTPSESRIDVNLYIPSSAKVKLGKRTIQLEQATHYPQDGQVDITVTPDKETQAQLALRIPGWTPKATVTVNGEEVQGVTTGQYLVIDRKWKAGDKVSLAVDMPSRIVRLEQFVAYERGPVVLARDSRFNDGFVDEVIMPASTQNGTPTLTPATPMPGTWMTFTTPVIHGTYSDRQCDIIQMHLCDFASAGNQWDEKTRYRVWLPLLYEPMYKGGTAINGYW